LAVPVVHHAMPKTQTLRPQQSQHQHNSQQPASGSGTVRQR
jgi:hypothetical protein